MLENINIINKCRKKSFEKLYDNYNKLYEIDLLRLLSDDWQIEKFYFNQNIYNLCDSILNYSMWKKDNNVFDRIDEDFPIEFWKIGLEIYGTDKNNRKILWSNCSIKQVNLNFEFLIPLLKTFICFTFEKLDNLIHKRSSIMITHSKLFSIKFLRFDLFKFNTHIFITYYPKLIHKIYIVDLPRNYSFIFKTIKHIDYIMTKNNYYDNLKKEKLQEITDISNIPIYYDGERSQKFNFNSKHFRKIKDFHISRNLTENKYKLYIEIEN